MEARVVPQRDELQISTPRTDPKCCVHLRAFPVSLDSEEGFVCAMFFFWKKNVHKICKSATQSSLQTAWKTSSEFTTVLSRSYQATFWDIPFKLPTALMSCPWPVVETMSCHAAKCKIFRWGPTARDISTRGSGVSRGIAKQLPEMTRPYDQGLWKPLVSLHFWPKIKPLFLSCEHGGGGLPISVEDLFVVGQILWILLILLDIWWDFLNAILLEGGSWFKFWRLVISEKFLEKKATATVAKIHFTTPQAQIVRVGFLRFQFGGFKWCFFGIFIPENVGFF